MLSQNQLAQAYVDIQGNPHSSFDTNQHLGEVFSTFSYSRFSKDERLEALRDTAHYKNQAELIENEVSRLNLLDNMASHNFSVTTEEAAGDRALYNISFSAETPIDAQTTLI